MLKSDKIPLGTVAYAYELTGEQIEDILKGFGAIVDCSFINGVGYENFGSCFFELKKFKFNSTEELKNKLKTCQYNKDAYGSIIDLLLTPLKKEVGTARAGYAKCWKEDYDNNFPEYAEKTLANIIVDYSLVDIKKVIILFHKMNFPIRKEKKGITKELINTIIAEYREKTNREKAFTQKEAAAMLRVNERTIRNWEKNGALEGYPGRDSRLAFELFVAKRHNNKLLMTKARAMNNARPTADGNIDAFSDDEDHNVWNH